MFFLFQLKLLEMLSFCAVVTIALLGISDQKTDLPESKTKKITAKLQLSWSFCSGVVSRLSFYSVQGNLLTVRFLIFHFQGCEVLFLFWSVYFLIL